MNRGAITASVASLVIGLATGIAGTKAFSDDGTSLTTTGKRPTTEVAVKRTTLQVDEQTTGELASSVTKAITTTASGTITQAATVGATIDRGGVLAKVDDQPVILLFGAQPAWREIGPNATDGADIRQLEENLQVLGYYPKSDTPDTTYDSDTEDAITAWETALGLASPDGTVPIGEVVFGASAIQITESTAAGTRLSPGDTLCSGRPATDDNLKVTFTVTEEADRYQVGKMVQISTTAGSEPAKITAFERAASGGQSSFGAQASSAASFTVTATPQPTKGSTSLAPGPVTVEIPTEVARNALAVPSRALVAVLEGGQAVQLADSTKLVPVDIGVFSNGWVQVTGTSVDNGTLKEGVKVVVPT